MKKFIYFAEFLRQMKTFNNGEKIPLKELVKQYIIAIFQSEQQILKRLILANINVNSGRRWIKPKPINKIRLIYIMPFVGLFLIFAIPALCLQFIADFFTRIIKGINKRFPD